MKKILIAGDSFAANWRIKHNGAGWVNLLENDYDVKNIAQAGVSEYKILKQIEQENLDNFDMIVISHTSPNRVYITEHPAYNLNPLHRCADLIYSDVKHHLKKNKSNKNSIYIFVSLIFTLL